jgi:hypothetical protein
VPLCVGVSELSLSKEEIPRARKVFSNFGVPAITSYPNNNPALAAEIFTGCFGDDYSVGPRLVERFLALSRFLWETAGQPGSVAAVSHGFEGRCLSLPQTR